MRENCKLPVYSFVLGESEFFLLTETSPMVFSFFLCPFGEAALTVVLFTSLLSELLQWQGCPLFRHVEGRGSCPWDVPAVTAGVRLEGRLCRDWDH